jgi:hypothetical protein
MHISRMQMVQVLQNKILEGTLVEYTLEIAMVTTHPVDHV